MDRVATVEGNVSETRVTRRKLLKRAAVGGGVLVGTPVITSSAYAQPHGGPNCRALVLPGAPGPARPVKCNPEEPCFGQTLCGGEIPVGSFCSCVPICGGAQHPDDGDGGRGGGCFCHEVQPCAGLTACDDNRDCPPGWKCTLSCCSPTQCFCLPPCGTNPIFGTIGAAVAAVGDGATTIG